MQHSKVYLCVISALLALSVSCKKNTQTLGETHLTLSASIAQSPALHTGEADYETYSDLKVPPLPPDQALSKFELEEGFRIEIVAHEPMVISPVAMDIDPDGRLWVIDMPSYMPVHDMDAMETSKRERVPVGRVVILEDTDGNGQMDTHRVFADSLILPRAIKVLNDGILIGEPPNVWFIRDTDGDGKGDSREIVYSGYGDDTDPNIHGFPGGLMWGMDNWLHSSSVDVSSIRRKDGQWQTRSFERLGQWGMSQNNWGRLYSSSNSRPLQTHLLPYGYSDRHPQFELDTGMNLSVGASEPLWPAHPTGVNRGYREGMLREDGTLIKATAVSSTVIYRGDQFGEEYVGNAFSPEPGGNLIKRYIIDEDPAKIKAEARFAYQDKEFLTSTDERFRPVNIYNAPDGSIYVLDMYRGVFEHASHLTDYLRDYTVEHGLHKANGPYGRIWRIVRDDRPIDYRTPRFSELTPTEVIPFLRHENGWLRDQAQQILVQCSLSGVVPDLEAMVSDMAGDALTRLHALWTLEGFDRSVYTQKQLTQTALRTLDDTHPRVRASALRILEPVLASSSSDVIMQLEELAKEEQAPYVQLQLLASLGESDSNAAIRLMAKILDANADSPYFREMALTGVYQREGQLAEILRNQHGWSPDSGETYASVLASLADAETERPNVDLEHLTEAQQALFNRGSQRYSTCMTCHGAEGQGGNIGAALAGSEWVEGEPDPLVRIVLQGFSGGAAERGEDISGVMPAHSFLPDEDVAAILTYIRQSWGNEAPPVDSADVARIRAGTDNSHDVWSPNELRALLD